MSKETLSTIIIITILIVVFGLLYGFAVDFQKTQCIDSGGKWISGIINGEYSYFCIPK